jgi:serine/threonine protein kinase
MTFIRSSSPLQMLERVLEEREAPVDERTDTWAFGVMLHHMFSPDPPFSEVTFLA